jgi:hypothetical protein
MRRDGSASKRMLAVRYGAVACGRHPVRGHGCRDYAPAGVGARADGERCASSTKTSSASSTCSAARSLTSSAAPPVLMVFDCLGVHGLDVRGLRPHRRRTMLEEELAEASGTASCGRQSTRSLQPPVDSHRLDTERVAEDRVTRNVTGQPQHTALWRTAAHGEGVVNEGLSHLKACRKR